jgi:Flp pilus assembly protein TadD
MTGNRQLLFVLVVGVACYAPAPLRAAADLKITLPRRSQPTLVQRLNQEGVEAIRKHQYEKAESLFYRAYLYDPIDPFTLNNLGYVAEIQGQLDRAEQLYTLASQQASNAVIARANLQQLQGKPMKEALDRLGNVPMRVNNANIEVIRLLSQGRASEAEALLQQTLALDPRNAFTLNNLGVVKEAEGDLPGAMKYYTEAANLRSTAPATVTENGAWQGTAISTMAEDSAKRVSERMHAHQTAQMQAAMLNLRGVSAINRNDWQEASHDFRQAYALDPYSAFSLNNAGYLSEMDGDLETAQFFYDKARNADDAGYAVGLATRRSVEGMHLSAVANENDQKVDDRIEQERIARQRQGGPIELKRRDHTPVDEIPAPSRPANAQPPNP